MPVNQRRSMIHIRAITLMVLGPLAYLACGGADRTATDTAVVQALILAPIGGADLSAPPVTITLDVRNLVIRPAGTDEPNSGHHHLFINRDIVPEGEVILSGPGIVHLGAGQSEHVLDTPGTYRVIAVLGDHEHARIPGAKTDTVQFVVR